MCEGRLKSLFLQDCIMMPMCACSICDECARAALTEAENNNNACPSCGEPDNSPEDLIPCRKVREKVNEFKSKMNSGAAKVRNVTTAVVNDLPAEMAPDRRRFPPANEMRPLYTERESRLQKLQQLERAFLDSLRREEEEEERL